MSTDPRLYVDAPLAAGAVLPLAAAQAHYLGTVLRRAPGSRLRLFNGRDGEWLARLASLRRDRAEVVVEEADRPQRPDGDLWLAFALLKRDATDLVVQKATELGAAALLPVITARTNAHRVNGERLRAIAIEAAEQCERLTVPEIAAPRPMAALLAGWPADRPLFAAVERSPEAAGLHPNARAGLLVGPEGGFVPAELDALRSHPIVRTVQIGPRVLRAETACIAGLALLQAPGCG